MAGKLSRSFGPASLSPASFGVTPSALRATKTLADLPLTFPPSLEAIRAVKLAPPRFATRPAFRLAGLRRRFARSQTAGIPGLWAEFWPHIGEIDGQRGREAFGVCLPGAAPEIDYLAAVEVAPDAAPLGLETYDAPAARYAVYARRGHATEIRSLFAAIYDHGLKNAGADYVDGPGLERYDHRFDPIAGEGRFELWIPVAAGR